MWRPQSLGKMEKTDQTLKWALLLLLLLSHFSCVQLCVTLWAATRQAPLSMEFSRQEYYFGLPCPPPGIFLTQGLNPGLLHCRQILHCLRHQGSPIIQQFVPASLASGFPCFCSCGFCGYKVSLALCLIFLLWHFSLCVCFFLCFALMTRRFLRRWC